MCFRSRLEVFKLPHICGLSETISNVITVSFLLQYFTMYLLFIFVIKSTYFRKLNVCYLIIKSLSFIMIL